VVFVYWWCLLDLVASALDVTKEAPMDCSKCQGLMVPERVTDGLTHLNEWRCLNCGFILDPVIVQHRTQIDSKTKAAAA